MAKNLLPTTPTGRRFVGLLGGAAALAGSAAALTFAASPASGITNLVVDSNGDAAATPSNCTNGTVGDCTLRDALAAAQDGDTITFDASIGSTITMTPVNGQFVIDHAITINGPGRDALTIDGANGTGVFYVTNAVTGTVALSGVTVTHGNAGNALGGGLATGSSQQLSSALDLTISDAAFLDSTAGTGGGLFIAADSVHLRNVIVSGNTADNAGGLVVTANDFDGSRLDVTGNTATRYNAGAYIASPLYGQQLTISDSTFSNNTEGLDTNAGAAGLSIRWDRGTATITGSTFADNVGRGAKLRGYLANITMANCTVSGNSSSKSGAGVLLYNPGGTATIAQTTVTANVSTASDASLYEGSGLSFFFYYSNSGSVTITGSIIAGNIGANVHDIGSIIATTLPFSIDHSLIGTVSSTITVTDGGGVTTNVSDPGLNALANNGGPTKTMSLKATSPAIDAGPDPVATFPGNQFDQRGTGFARIAFGRSDIGAFEIQEPTPVDPDAPVVPAFTG